jgi:hypothetical protein
VEGFGTVLECNEVAGNGLPRMLKAIRREADAAPFDCRIACNERVVHVVLQDLAAIISDVDSVRLSEGDLANQGSQLAIVFISGGGGRVRRDRCVMMGERGVAFVRLLVEIHLRSAGEKFWEEHPG